MEFSAPSTPQKEEAPTTKNSISKMEVSESSLEIRPKTVLISRNQSVKMEDNTSVSCNETSRSADCNSTSTFSPLGSETIKNHQMKPLGSETASVKPSTPDVLIQPASPAVLAAHKKSVITVTLRQRSPSSSSQKTLSRSASSCSSASKSSKISSSSVTPDALASIITVNGVSLAENEQLNAEFASSLAAAAQAKDETSCSCERPQKSSCHTNNTASYVHINCPKNSYSSSQSIASTSKIKAQKLASTNGHGSNRLAGVSSSQSPSTNTAKTVSDSVPCNKSKCSSSSSTSNSCSCNNSSTNGVFQTQPANVVLRKSSSNICSLENSKRVCCCKNSKNGPPQDRHSSCSLESQCCCRKIDSRVRYASGSGDKHCNGHHLSHNKETCSCTPDAPQAVPSV